MTLPLHTPLPQAPDDYTRRLTQALTDAFRRVAHEVNARPPAVLVLVGSWAAAAGYAAPAAIASGTGLVVLHGMAAGGATGSAISTLPDGMRPSVDRVFPVATGAGSGSVTVRADGAIVLTTGSGWCSLDGISFYAT